MPAFIPIFCDPHASSVPPRATTMSIQTQNKPVVPGFIESKNCSVPLTPKQLKENFLKQDIDGDNRLSEQELKKAFEKLGSRWSDWRVFRALCHADAKNDGYISMTELDEVVKYAAKKINKIS